MLGEERKTEELKKEINEAAKKERRGDEKRKVRAGDKT